MRRIYVKVCPACGKTFETCFKKVVCCSHACANRKLRMLAYQASDAGKRRAMRERMAARDAAYAASPYAPKVVVEVRGRRVIETRGRAVIGCKSAGCVLKV